MTDPELVVLDGVPMPTVAYLEVPGADRLSWRVPTRVPWFLGGDDGPVETEVVVFERTDELCEGFSVFRPAGAPCP